MSPWFFILGYFVFCLVFLFPVPVVPVEKEIIVLMRKRRLIAFENGRERFQFECSEGDPAHPTKPGMFRFHDGAKTDLFRANVTNIPDRLYFTKDGKAIEGAICCESAEMSTKMPNQNAETKDFNAHGCVQISEGDAKKLFPWTDSTTRVRIVFW